MKGITLIGMPSSGKSTIGKLLAERLKWRFIDLDDLIKKEEGMTVNEILKQKGEKELLRLENSYTLRQDFFDVVFSPGGSIIYSDEAIGKLKKDTMIIYLETPLKDIKKRIERHSKKEAVVGLREKGIVNLFEERAPIYKLNADHIIDCSVFNRDSGHGSLINYIISLLSVPINNPPKL
ncbi:MAG: shikimate kinase [bacterium]|nr:shikimate kinase [bacterium]